MSSSKKIEQSYEMAKERYSQLGVNTETAIHELAKIPISLHCWQGDDVGGFEDPDAVLDGGIMATGNYPGKARTADELRMDVDKALDMIPGNHRFNLHAIYAETHGQKINRTGWWDRRHSDNPCKRWR